jgi:hypothetical protein
MRRIAALALFVAGQAALASLAPMLAALPAFGTFLAGGLLLAHSSPR